jgi:hypothetical protein
MARPDTGTPARADNTVPMSRRVCVTVVVLAALALCLVRPLLSFAIVPAFMPAAFVLSYDDDETTTAGRAWWPVIGATVLGGLAGLIVGSYADNAVAAALAQEAHAAATSCHARSFGACGLGMMRVELGAGFLLPVVIILTGVLLSACRARRGFFVGLSGGVLSVVLAYALGALFLIVPGEFIAVYAAIGALGYSLAAVVYGPTVHPYLRAAALAVPMVAVATLTWL